MTLRYQPPVLIPFVGGYEMYGGRATEADLIDLATSLPLEPSLIMIGHIIDVWTRDRARADELFASLLDRRCHRRWINTLKRRPLIFPTRAASAARLILCHAKHPMERRDLTVGEWRALARLALEVSDLDEPPIDPGTDREAFLQSYMLRQHYLGRLEVMPAAAIGRSHRMFTELTNELDRSELEHAQLLESFEASCGVPLRIYVAAGGAIVTRFVGASDTPGGSDLTREYFANAASAGEAIDWTLDDLSYSPEEFRDRFASRPTDLPEPGLWDLKQFFMRPLCRVAKDRYVAPYPPGLIRRLLTDGVYSRLEVAVGRRRKGDLHAAVGRLFETYLGELLVEAHRERDADVFLEHEYVRGELGPDFLVWDRGVNTLVMGEATVSSINFDETLLKGNREAFIKDLREVVFEKVEQLARKLDMFRSGRLRYEGVAAEAPVWPIVVLLGPFPIGPTLAPLVREVLMPLRLAARSAVHPLSITTAADLEVSLAWTEATGCPLSESLRAWHARGASDQEPLGEFVAGFADRLRPPRVADAAFRRAAEAWVTQLGLRNFSADQDAPHTPRLEE